MAKLYSEREVRERLRPILKKLPNLETEQLNNIHQGKTLFLKSPFQVAQRENKEEAKV